MLTGWKLYIISNDYEFYSCIKYCNSYSANEVNLCWVEILSCNFPQQVGRCAFVLQATKPCKMPTVMQWDIKMQDCKFSTLKPMVLIYCIAQINILDIVSFKTKGSNCVYKWIVVKPFCLSADDIQTMLPPSDGILVMPNIRVCVRGTQTMAHSLHSAANWSLPVLIEMCKISGIFSYSYSCPVQVFRVRQGHMSEKNIQMLWRAGIVVTTTRVSVLEWCFRPRFCTCKAILGRRHPGLMRWILLGIMPLVQDRSLDLLISSPARYHCTTDAPIVRVLVHLMFCCLIKMQRWLVEQHFMSTSWCKENAIDYFASTTASCFKIFSGLNILVMLVLLSRCILDI